MNKLAQQFQNDVVARYQQKMSALAKRAEGTDLTLLEKIVSPGSAANVAENYREAAEQRDAINRYKELQKYVEDNDLQGVMGPKFQPERWSNGGFTIKNQPGPDFSNWLEYEYGKQKDLERKAQESGIPPLIKNYSPLDKHRAIFDKNFLPSSAPKEDRKRVAEIDAAARNAFRIGDSE